MAARGRPSLVTILSRLDLLRSDLDRLGGLPFPSPADEVWGEIWRADAHHSTAIEGNTLTAREVDRLLDTGRAGRRRLAEYLEVRAYADAARWVYDQARPETAPWVSGRQLTLTEVREIHRRVVEPVWLVEPPRSLDAREGPGSFRRHDITRFSSGMRPPSWTEVPHLMTDWVGAACSPLPERLHPIELLAQLHVGFERVHPFRDGNGRTGRLLVNLLLVRHGYPPLVVRNRQRDRYLTALGRADRGDLGPLTHLLAGAAIDSLESFLLAASAEEDDLLPLATLASEELSRGALAQAVRRGRLRAVRRSGSYYSTRAWLAEYSASRRGR